MGFRFQKRLSILPGVRINLSKSGASASVGPRGADVNIGRGGIATNAGIPGTGLSYRQKLGGKTKSGWIGVLALVIGLGFAAYKNADKIGHLFASAPAAQTQAGAPAAGGVRYVRRNNSVLRETEKSSGKALKHEAKGAAVTLLAVDGPWSKVQDGDVTGWMRTSVLGDDPSK